MNRLLEIYKTCFYLLLSPANGMSPPITSGHVEIIKPHKETQATKDCLGTIICMLSCKDGYTLGRKDPDGCQACHCTKKKDEHKGMFH